MKREFMEEYYDLKYPDTFMSAAIERYEDCRILWDEVMKLEGLVEAAMKEKGTEFLQLHSKLFAVKGNLDELVMRLAYLQGAEDRENMLK